MSSVRILIVEDRLLIAEDISFKLKGVGYEITDLVISGEEALTSISKNQPDIVLMDIELDGDLDGIDTAHQVQKQYPHIPIIFLTDLDDDRTFNRAKYTNPASFIPKPFNLRSMSFAINLALHNISKQQLAATAIVAEPTEGKNKQFHFLSDRIFIREKDGYQKVEVNDILWIEADGAYCNIITKNKVYKIAISSSEFERRYQHEHLVRIHRTYIVNVTKIKAMTKTEVKIIDTENLIKQSIKRKDGKLPVGVRFRKEFFENFPTI